MNLCVVGATGKFGRSIISQNNPDIKISGAVCSDSNPLIGKTLREVGVQGSDAILRGSTEVERAAAESDVVLFVSNPHADLTNIPKIVRLRKRIALGTTGFTQAQTEQLKAQLKNVPSIVASNFSIGANILFEITRMLSRFNELYDYSIIEEHHKLKADAPSGTARTMVQLLNSNSDFPVTVTDRSVRPQRVTGEIEVVSLRGGGTPGIHQLILSGDHDMIKVEHVAFSRAASASGAILACKWLATIDQPGIYSMQDVLGFSNT